MAQTNVIAHGLETTPQQEDFAAFVRARFDAGYYLQTYPDVSTSGFEPLAHCLQRGLAEGRQISRHVVLRHGDVARRSSSRIWRHFRWCGTDFAARLIDPLSPDVMMQIANQARHDPAVLAAGADVISQLSQQDRENVHLDVQGLRRAVPRSPDILLIVPDLGTSRPQTLAAKVARVLGDSGRRSVQTIVTDHVSDPNPADFPERDLWYTTNVLFWPNFWIHGPESVNKAQLAQLISVLHPRVTIVADSRSGHEIVARYGRALSTRTQIYCIRTAAADDDVTDSCFVPQALAFATLVTDDAALADQVRSESSHPSLCRAVVLPHHSAITFRDAVIALFGQP